MPSANRLQPWPDWATRQYWQIRSQIEKLEQLGKWVFKHGFERHNVARLERFLPAMEETARTINLYCLELSELRGSDRWPNWANDAHALTMNESHTAAQWLARIREHVEANHWQQAERLLQECILSAQRMRQALMRGPAPELNDIDIFIIQEAEQIAIEQFMKGEDQ